MKKYFVSLMLDERNSLPDRCVKLLLSLATVLYGIVISVWDMMYRKGLLKAHSVNSKVISVGNLTLGGTGKTPLALFIASRMKEKGKKPALIMRGYGDDEWRMAVEALKGVPVYVGRDRVSLALKAIEENKPDALILDDGFQHRALKKDVNIAVIDASIPLSKLRLFPRGILREPLDAVRFADLVIINKSDMSGRNADEYKSAFRARYPKTSLITACYKPLHFVRTGDNSLTGLDIISGKKIAVISAIANPAYFKFMLKNLGAVIVKEADYPDHYDYKENDIEKINIIISEGKAEYCVTTSKDYVKLRKFIREIRCVTLVLDIGMSVEGSLEALDKWIL